MRVSILSTEWQTTQPSAAAWWGLPSKGLAVVLVHAVALWFVLSVPRPSHETAPPRPLEMRMLDAVVPPPGD
ncbi:hypothetical protein [Parvibium lacunae]|uniref:Uncharacterized protein n=1 Tax=Parvibium lacunae TaxID=1888893 RepID=A0A368L707_9BURK|nr:hypothetical protein [Parvibium lacunae]RCS59433.1 hypothetical protein DU000_01500 [Parvibium lacunae]